jgi:hypothetical protein
MTRAKEAPDTFDLSALRREARGETERFVLVYDGDRYELPPPAEIDIESLAAWAQSQNGDSLDWSSVALGLQALLGDRYEEFRKYRVTAAEAGAIFGAWASHYGLNTGESSASSS